MSVQFCLLLLLSVQLIREGDGVITGPRSRRELGQVEPRTIEVEAGEELLLRNKEKRWRSVQSCQLRYRLVSQPRPTFTIDNRWLAKLLHRS